MKPLLVKTAVITLIALTPLSALLLLNDKARPAEASDPAVRIEAIRDLKNNRNLDSLARIVEMLDDRDVEVADAALAALENLFEGGFLEKTGSPDEAREMWKEYWRQNGEIIIYSPRDGCFKVPTHPYHAVRGPEIESR